jgi:hypothetical protein
VDAAGNRSAASDVVNVVAIAGDGPLVTGVSVDSGGKPLRPGEVVTITLSGLSGGSATAELTDIAEGIILAEVGSTGAYEGAYTVTDGDVAETTTSYRVVGALSDDYGASTLAGPEVMIVGQDIIDDVTPPEIASASLNAEDIVGSSGKLVPGDLLLVEIQGEAQGFASFSLPGVTGQVAMTETAPGIYAGSYRLTWDDEGEALDVAATLSDLAGNTATIIVDTVDIDSRVRLMVSARDELLPADSKSETRITVTAEDANGRGVEGHELALTLSTTDEYTGVVGGGRVEDRSASADDEDDLEIKWDAVTDRLGEVEATYTAGFSAKTALIVAKDLTTEDIGAGWLNTYVYSTVAIELTPLSARRATELANMRLSVTPGWLTADGRSKARVKVWLTDFSGNPIKGERVNFSQGSANGTIRTIRGITDSDGLAEAQYRAGKVAGYVSLTAEAAKFNVTRSLQLELRSDAPAKIGLVASKLVLPADGRSTSDIKAVVTDINDNVNMQVPVLFSVIDGSGSVTPAEELTDDEGVVNATFKAGRSSGKSVVEARHTSRAPTEEELRCIYGTVFVPRLIEKQDRERMKVDSWLVEPGDDIVKGQSLVVLKVGQQSWTLTAKHSGEFVREVKSRRDRVTLGETLGYVKIEAESWTALSVDN